MLGYYLWGGGLNTSTVNQHFDLYQHYHHDNQDSSYVTNQQAVYTVWMITESIHIWGRMELGGEQFQHLIPNRTWRRFFFLLMGLDFCWPQVIQWKVKLK